MQEPPHSNARVRREGPSAQNRHRWWGGGLLHTTQTAGWAVPHLQRLLPRVICCPSAGRPKQSGFSGQDSDTDFAQAAESRAFRPAGLNLLLEICRTPGVVVAMASGVPQQGMNLTAQHDVPDSCIDF